MFKASQTKFRIFWVPAMSMNLPASRRTGECLGTKDTLANPNCVSFKKLHQFGELCIPKIRQICGVWSEDGHSLLQCVVYEVRPQFAGKEFLSGISTGGNSRGG